MLKQALETIDSVGILKMTHMAGVFGGHNVCVIMTRCVGKLICDSPLSALESLSPLTTTMSLEAS